MVIFTPNENLRSFGVRVRVCVCVCVCGRACEKAGMPSGGRTMDRCGVCGGDGSGCRENELSRVQGGHMDAKTKSSLPKPLIYLPESFHTVRFRKKEEAAVSFAAALAAGSNRYSSHS